MNESYDTNVRSPLAGLLLFPAATVAAITEMPVLRLYKLSFVQIIFAS